MRSNPARIAFTSNGSTRHAPCPATSGIEEQLLVMTGRYAIGDVLFGAWEIETLEDVAALEVADPDNLSFLTQTTLSVDDTAEIVAALQARFPSIQVPRSEDICYATTNRQAAVKAIACECGRMLVIGAPNSSNSLRLAEVAERQGVEARLIQRATDIDWDWLGSPSTLGLTAGASAPEILVREVIDALRARFDVTEREADHSPERMTFKLPRELVA